MSWEWEARSGDAGAWLPARVPGTAAGVLRDAGLPFGDLDEQDWTFRTRFDAGPDEAVLHLDGIATVAEVRLNGERVLESASMWAEHEIDVADRLRPERNALEIHCHALAPLLRERRKPRARWRTRICDNNLRWFRTMLLGRCPGFAPGPPALGPWRAVRLEPRGAPRPRVRTRLDGADGVVTASGEIVLSGPSGTHRGQDELRVPDVARWWPHTHGEPALHDVHVDGVFAGRVGFRSLRFAADFERDGLDLHVNGVPVFARGAVWTPVDPIGLAPSREELSAALELVRDSGMNMLRIPGTGAYESTDFHDLCDELGILVWQDLMFANMDYPVADPDFRATVEAEADQVLAGLAGRPSLAVVCGNSEIEQQVAMLGLDPALARGELFGELLPAAVRRAGTDAAYVPSAPCGGTLPFRPDRGVANYFGVGGYRRPPEDVRRAEVRFASECLAFANVGDDGDLRGAFRDVGADWDFGDVRDHYFRVLFGDPEELRASDPDRYVELSQAVSGEVMAEVFGEWRRRGSPCRGGLVLWLRDLRPGPGWGVVDSAGRPKVALHHLRRALAPVAVWTTDEGLGGIAIHVANDRPEPLAARLRVALYRADGIRVGQGADEIALPPHGGGEWDVEALLGHFADVSWAYRFGPPALEAIVVSLERGDELIAQAFRFPAGRPLARGELGLEGRFVAPDRLEIRSERLAYGVRVAVGGFVADDDALCLEPGVARSLVLRPLGPDATPRRGSLTALNFAGEVAIS